MTSIQQQQGVAKKSLSSHQKEESVQERSFDTAIPRAGFYIPPPGYIDCKGEKGFDGAQREGEKDGFIQRTRDRYVNSPYNQEYRQRKKVQEEFQERRKRVNSWNHIHNEIMPTLSYNDWSVPQAKQILSHWATLATLLGGVQATLLAYYSKEENVVSGVDLKVYRMVIAISCAGLFLEVYGALLAAGTIVASISLQAKSVAKEKEKRKTILSSQTNSPQQTRFKQNQLDEMEETCHSNDLFFVGTNQSYLGNEILGGMTGIASHPSDIELSSSNLSPRASAILDRLTVLVGCIIPLGAGFELIGLAGYSAWYLGTSVAITMILTLVIAVVATVIVGFFGMQAGTKAMKAGTRAMKASQI